MFRKVIDVSVGVGTLMVAQNKGGVGKVRLH